jgi:cation diffusion facilitator CzcD-associated flavoprotein CzcO
MPKVENEHVPVSIDAVIVGAGFSGLYLLHRLRNLLGLSACIIEAGGGVGGTWFWNTYPGARCDIPSLEYSYQFSEELQQDWEWRERYATQPEILSYANHVADRFDLRKDIQINTRVISAAFDEDTLRWTVTTDKGNVFSAKFCIMATGCLSSANLPGIKGRDSFQGPTYHTGRWPRERVDFTGQRVGVIGTGSSGIQAIPLIAREAKHLTVFQRTPSYTVPARNQPLDPEFRREFKARYPENRARNWAMPFGADFDSQGPSALAVSPEEREKIYEKQWAKGGLLFLGTFDDLMISREANESAAEFIRKKIRSIVKDPAVAEALIPRQTLGCKRLCVDSGYYETFNLPNVTLVDLRASPIEEITATGIRVATGLVELDTIIFATGFDAITGAICKINVVGVGGLALKDKWANQPRAYLGLATAGFPNFFFVNGPGSPSVLSNMLPSIEQNVEWICDCINHVITRRIRTIQATPAAEEQWASHVNAVAESTLFTSCNSWYLGSNVPGKQRNFMPLIGVPPYVAKCKEVVRNGYEGFKFDS